MYYTVRLLICKYLVHSFLVKDICLVECEILSCYLLDSVDCLLAGIVKVVENYYLVACIKQLNTCMTSYITCSACYQNFHNVFLLYDTVTHNHLPDTCAFGGTVNVLRKCRSPVYKHFYFAMTFSPTLYHYILLCTIKCGINKY